jgi:hypothetical protein
MLLYVSCLDLLSDLLFLPSRALALAFKANGCYTPFHTSALLDARDRFTVAYMPTKGWENATGRLVLCCQVPVCSSTGECGQLASRISRQS